MPAQFPLFDSSPDAVSAGFLLLVLLGALSGCGSRQSPEAERSRTAPEALLELTVTADRGPSLRARLVVPEELLAGAGGPLDLAFPTSLAGRTGFMDDIHGISATDHEGVPLRVLSAGPGRFLLQTDGRGPVTVSWALTPATRVFDDATRHRAFSDGDRLLASGFALMPAPLNLPLSPRIRVTLSGDIVAAGLPRDREVTLSELHDAVLLAGRWRALDHLCAGELLSVFSAVPVPDALPELICNVIRAQRRLHRHRQTWTVLVPRVDPLNPLTGTAFPGGHILEVPPEGPPLGHALVELVAHEEMHRLIGHRIRPAPRSASDMGWFIEGVTDYLALLSLSAAELMPPSAFASRLDAAWRAIAGHDVQDMLVFSHAPPHGAEQRLPYDVGLLLGAIIDLGLRSRGEDSLGAFVTWLAEQPRQTRASLTTARLMSLLESRTGGDWTAVQRATATGESLASLLPALSDIGIATSVRSVTVMDFGLRFDRTFRNTWYITSVVPGSPADRAGLQRGMQLASQPVLATHRTGEEYLSVAIPSTPGTRTIVLRGEPRVVDDHRLVLVDGERLSRYLRRGVLPEPERAASPPGTSHPHEFLGMTNVNRLDLLRDRALSDPEIPSAVRNFLAHGSPLEEIRLDPFGRWHHEGVRFTNQRLAALFHRSLERTTAGTWVLRIPPYTYPVLVDLTGHFVTRLRLNTTPPLAELADGTTVSIGAEHLVTDGARFVALRLESGELARLVDDAWRSVCAALESDSDGRLHLSSAAGPLTISALEHSPASTTPLPPCPARGS